MVPVPAVPLGNPAYTAIDLLEAVGKPNTEHSSSGVLGFDVVAWLTVTSNH